MDWTSSRPCWWRSADNGQWSLGCGGRAVIEWCGHRCPTPEDEPQRRALRPPRTTHNLHTTKIYYRFHPSYGVEVEVVRHLRRTESAVVIVRLPEGAQVALPEWMLNSQACDRLSQEEKPRIAIDALLELHRLINAQHIEDATHDRICAESPSGGQDAQKRSDRAAARTALRGGRNLDRTSGIDAGTLPNSVAPAVGKRSQNERTGAK